MSHEYRMYSPDRGTIGVGGLYVPQRPTVEIFPAATRAMNLRAQFLPDLEIVSEIEGRPKRPIAFVFKGQGTQKVGMGVELIGPDVDEIYAIAERIVGYSVRSLSLNGPADMLARTVNAQTAILARNLAALGVSQREDPATFDVEPWLYLGHSLGQYAALVAAGALTMEDAFKLVAVRQLGMEYVSLKHPGAGNIVVRMRQPKEGQEKEFRRTYKDVVTTCTRTDGMWKGIINHPTQIVFAGTREAMEKIEAEVERNAKEHVRADKVKISTPAHSPLMQPAAEMMQEFVDEGHVTFREPKGYVVLNTTARPTKNVKTIKREVTDWHLTKTVNWQGSLEFVDDIETEEIAEFGGDSTLLNMANQVIQDRRKTAIVITTALAVAGGAAAALARLRTHRHNV